MSGVAKDDTNPTQPSDGTVSAPDAGSVDATAVPANSKDDAEARAARRNAPFLRVVTDNDPDFVPPDASGAPHQRIGAIIRAARENARAVRGTISTAGSAAGRSGVSRTVTATSGPSINCSARAISP